MKPEIFDNVSIYFCDTATNKQKYLLTKYNINELDECKNFIHLAKTGDYEYFLDRITKVKLRYETSHSNYNFGLNSLEKYLNYLKQNQEQEFFYC